MTREETQPEPQPQHRVAEYDRDTLTPRTTSEHPAPESGTSRDDMRRDTQQPDYAREGAVNVFRFSA